VTSGGHLKVGPGPANHLKIPGKNSGKKIPEKFVIKKESGLLPSPHAADPFLRFFGASPISGSVTQHMPREEQEDAHPCEHSRPPLGDAIVGATDYGSGLGTIWARLVAALVQELI
jgi:hypothetical protein